MLAVSSQAARAHEPFQITTEARTLPAGLVLHVTLASRTATLACPSAVGAIRSLTSLDLERYRAGLDACARGLYVVRSAGRVLEPLAADVRLTEEGDFDARLRYAPAAPGLLTLEAVHLARLPDAMYGAELTVTSERDFVGQALLRRASPVLSVHVPQSAAPDPARAPRKLSFFDYRLVGALVTFAAFVASVVWLLRKRT
ncbi:MAG TPA: hypothetical protein VLJ38_10610 [Polyangiaceae bacterium]|nr:hypothetical protein [Polyangiaceae bacterium]